MRRESIEGVIRSSFEVFQRRIPVTRLSANIHVFPGITETDRIRVNTDITLRNELVCDIGWDLSFYSSYDNQLSEGIESQDCGVITSIGTSF